MFELPATSTFCMTLAHFPPSRTRRLKRTKRHISTPLYHPQRCRSNVLRRCRRQCHHISTPLDCPHGPERSCALVGRRPAFFATETDKNTQIRDLSFPRTGCSVRHCHASISSIHVSSAVRGPQIVETVYFDTVLSVSRRRFTLSHHTAKYTRWAAVRAQNRSLAPHQPSHCR